MAKNDLVPITDYALMSPDGQDAVAVMVENLDGGKMDLSMMDIVKTPSGGSKFWTIPDVSAEGGERTSQVLEGVLVYKHFVRGYWEPKDGVSKPDGSAPDCSSNDGKKPIPGSLFYGKALESGEPITCENCAMAQFPEHGGRQPCKLFQHLYLLPPDRYLPLIVRLAPTGVKPFRKYMGQISQLGTPYWAVVTKIGLEKDTSASGDEYVRPVFTNARTLDAEERAALKEKVATIRTMFA